VGLVVYIGFAQPDERIDMAGRYARNVQRFEELSGALCVVIPYDRVSRDLMQRLAPDAVIMSGFGRSFQQYDVKSFLGVADWVQSTEVPTLAICGSHQLLGFIFTTDLRSVERLEDQPMRRLRPGEPVADPNYHPEFFMERGFYCVQINEAGCADPLFAGLGREAYFCESHYCEVKQLPSGFELLASTPECRIQAMRHRNRPLYGVQFHPEEYTEKFPAGKKLLENFFSLAFGGG
jgi:GMP synthase-like glutamine amidotransferase